MRMKWTVGTAAFVLWVSMLAGQSGADESPKSAKTADTKAVDAKAADIAKAIAEAGKPGPEHAKLKPLAGQWTYTGKCWMMPGQPPVEIKGTVERKWILGGLFLDERISGTGFGGDTPFESFGLLGYDKNAKKYTWTFACNMGSGSSNGLGTVDASGKLVYQSTCYCPVERREITARDEIRFEGKDKVVMESYKIDGGKDVKVMEIVSVRQK